MRNGMPESLVVMRSTMRPPSTIVLPLGTVTVVVSSCALTRGAVPPPGTCTSPSRLLLLWAMTSVTSRLALMSGTTSSLSRMSL